MLGLLFWYLLGFIRWMKSWEKYRSGNLYGWCWIGVLIKAVEKWTKRIEKKNHKQKKYWREWRPVVQVLTIGLSGGRSVTRRFLGRATRWCFFPSIWLRLRPKHGIYSWKWASNHLCVYRLYHTWEPLVTRQWALPNAHWNTTILERKRRVTIADIVLNRMVYRDFSKNTNYDNNVENVYSDS